MVTAKEDTVLKLMPEVQKADAQGLIFVPIQYTDPDGVWKPMEKHRLTVTVDNGMLMGLGSANAYVDGNYTQNVTETYYGEAMAVVRAGSSGMVRITVCDGSRSCTAEIPVRTC